MLEKDKPTVVWPLDEFTNGNSIIELALNGGANDAKRLLPFLVMSGFKETLQDLTDHGFQNLAFSDDYNYILNDVLRLTGLREFFRKTEGREDWNERHVRGYGHFAGMLGLSAEEAREKMVAVGVHDYDQSFGMPGMVYIQHDAPHGMYTHDVSVLGSVALGLFEAGGNNFEKGFEKTYQKAGSDLSLQDNPGFGLFRRSQLGEASFYMRYIPEDEGFTPQIFFPKGSKVEGEPTEIDTSSLFAVRS